MNWIIVVEYEGRAPDVFAGPEEWSEGAFIRLCTIGGKRVTLWEPVNDTSMMHEFARHEA